MRVHPRRILKLRKVELAHAEHHLTATSVDRIAVDEYVVEVVIGPYRLELLIGAQQRRVIPHAYIPHGFVFGRELGGRHLRLRREGHRSHAVEPEAPPRKVEMEVKIFFLPLVLVRLDDVLLHHAGQKRARREARHEQRADEDCGELPGRLEKVHEEQSRGGEQRKGQHGEGREYHMFVRVARAEDYAGRRKEQLIAREPAAGAP